MKCLIIEDEVYAAKHLQNLIANATPTAVILDVVDSVEEAVKWLSSHNEPDLIFLDVQLADGLSFQIFKKIKIEAPVIFTTAHDDYALEAFSLNSIDYLLKPIDKDAFARAIHKFENHFHNAKSINWESMIQLMNSTKKDYKKRFLIKQGSAFSYLPIEDIKLFFSEDGVSFAFTKENKKHLLDDSLETLKGLLDPDRFFKISRKCIVSIDDIETIHPYLNNRLKVKMKNSNIDDLIISREKVKAFKKWLTK